MTLFIWLQRDRLPELCIKEVMRANALDSWWQWSDSDKGPQLEQVKEKASSFVVPHQQIGAHLRPPAPICELETLSETTTATALLRRLIAVLSVLTHYPTCVHWLLLFALPTVVRGNRTLCSGHCFSDHRLSAGLISAPQFVFFLVSSLSWICLKPICNFVC